MSYSKIAQLEARIAFLEEQLASDDFFIDKYELMSKSQRTPKKRIFIEDDFDDLPSKEMLMDTKKIYTHKYPSKEMLMSKYPSKKTRTDKYPSKEIHLDKYPSKDKYLSKKTQMDKYPSKKIYTDKDNKLDNFFEEISKYKRNNNF